MRNCKFISALVCALVVSSLAVLSCGAAEAAVPGGRLVIHGRAPLREMVGRDGKGVALREALVTTAPRGYSINLPNAGAWADAPVSWRGHRPFDEVLKQIVAEQPDLLVDVDTDLRLVTITKQRATFGSPRQPDQAQGTLPSNGQPRMLEQQQTPLLDRASQGNAPQEAHFMTKQPPLLAWPRAAGSRSVDSAGAIDAGHTTAGATAAGREPEAAPVVTAAQPASARLPVAAPKPMPEAASVAPALAATVQTWTIGPADRTIRVALARWASEAGWQFVWDVPTDYAVDASATINGTLEQALNAVAQALKRSQVPIQVILYKGNKVIRVVGEGAA